MAMGKRKRENGLHKLLQDREVGSWQYYRSVKHRQILEMLPRNASDGLNRAIGDVVHNKVSELTLRRTNISAEGAKALAEALKVNPALQKLVLCCNYISAEGAKALAEALKGDSALQSISAEGAKELTKSTTCHTKARRRWQRRSRTFRLYRR